MIYFDINLDPTSEFDLFIEDMEAVKQSLSNLLQTRTNTRAFRSELGMNIDEGLFLSLNDDDIFVITSSLASAIATQLPEVTLDLSALEVTKDLFASLVKSESILQVQGL